MSIFIHLQTEHWHCDQESVSTHLKFDFSQMSCSQVIHMKQAIKKYHPLSMFLVDHCILQSWACSQDNGKTAYQNQ